jgi:hypothetical protein
MVDDRFDDIRPRNKQSIDEKSSGKDMKLEEWLM